MVRSDSASVLVPTIDLEIPATGQKGEVWSDSNMSSSQMQSITMIGDDPGGSSAAHHLWFEPRSGGEKSSPPRGRRED